MILLEPANKITHCDVEIKRRTISINGVFGNFDSRAVRQSELSAKTGGGANAGLMELEENIKPFPSIPSVLGNHQKNGDYHIRTALRLLLNLDNSTL